MCAHQRGLSRMARCSIPWLLSERIEYVLHGQDKTLGQTCPERECQLRSPTRQRRWLTAAHAPNVGVDTMKRELVGQFEIPDRSRTRLPTPMQPASGQHRALACLGGSLSTWKSHGSETTNDPRVDSLLAA
jgi:hypothetical protein